MKHGSKSKENLIGKIIYGFLLFMPLLAIGVTCAYVVLNKNAYQSYGDTTNVVQEQVGSSQELVAGQLYTLTYNGNAYTNYQTYYVLDNETNIVNLYFPNETWQVKSFYPFYDNNRTRLIVYDTNNTPHSVFNFEEISRSFYFVNKNTMNFLTTLSYYDLTYQTYDTAKLDNVFYYSIDKVEQSPLFNWSTNTSLYTILDSTCNTLGITTTFIPMLLAYWLLTSLMYLLYDIALIMVHMAHNKIHEFESSI